ncbi:uncharacterized protein TNCV_3315841 [Trichonephila clavipes]|nr:uncharacterized protein TNCV_3315841 [Trichonephila clavipes]
MIRRALKLAEFNIEWEHRSGTQNTVADVLSRNPIKNIIGEKVNSAIIRDLVLSSRDQLIEEQRTDPKLGHIYRYVENPENSSVNAAILGDIERLVEEASQKSKTEHEKWEKYYNRRRCDVQIKVNDWVLVAAHPLSSATRKVVAKFKPKFEGPYRVLDVKNNNVVIWKAGKRLTINVDQSKRRSKESRDGKKKGSEVKRELEEKGLSFRNDQCEKHTNKTNKRGQLIRSIPSSWSEKGRMIKKSKNQKLGYKRANEYRSGGSERKIRKGSEHRVPKRNLSSNDTNSVFPNIRKKSRREETVAPTTSGYNLRPRIGKREESRPTIERKAQQGGPVRSRKGRERNDSPYIEERKRSSNKNDRRGGDQQWQDQERRGTWTKKSLSLEVLVGNANYTSHKNQVCISDESTFEILQNKSQFVRRGEKFHSECVVQTVKHPTKIMVWSVINGKGTGRLYVVEGIIWQDVLKNLLIPQLEEWIPNGEPYIFMQDGALCHTARSIKFFFGRTKYPFVGLAGIGDIPIDAVHVYTDGSRDDYYGSGSGIYIKSQDHILRTQRRNPDGCSVFRSELIAIDEALGSLASLPNGKEIWILSDSRSAIQHLSNWQSVRDNVGVSILTKLKRLSTSHQIHLQWIPSHIDLEGNEIADTLAKAGACEVLEPSHHRVPRAHQEGLSRRSLAGVGLSESIRYHGPGLALLTNGGVQQKNALEDLIEDNAQRYLTRELHLRIPQNTLKSFQTTLSMVIWDEILQRMDKISEILQREQLDLLLVCYRRYTR